MVSNEDKWLTLTRAELSHLGVFRLNAAHQNNSSAPCRPPPPGKASFPIPKLQAALREWWAARWTQDRDPCLDQVRKHPLSMHPILFSWVYSDVSGKVILWIKSLHISSFLFLYLCSLMSGVSCFLFSCWRRKILQCQFYFARLGQC